MQPLLKIQSIPIKIEAQTKRASLQHSTAPAPVPQRRRPAPQPQQQRPMPQPRPQAEPQPLPADKRVAQNRGAQRPPAPLDSNGNYLQEAANAVQAYNQNSAVDDSAVAEVAAAQFEPVEYQDTAPVDYEPAQTHVPAVLGGYSMDRETFDWSVSEKPQLEYIPASIEYSVSQYPEVIIEYVGEPIYVPASANPNYVPPPDANKKD